MRYTISKMQQTSAYGFGTLVIINSAILLSLLLVFHPKTKGDLEVDFSS